MPSVKSFTLTLDAVNENGTFSEGDTLSGNVTLDLMKEISIQSLYVKAKGDASVRWSEKRGDHNRNYSASRRYFKLKQFLVPMDAKDTLINQGAHVYKFNLKIPPGSMPPSFRGPHGTIIYKLEVVLSRSWKMDRKLEKILQFVSKAIPNLQSLMSRQVGSVDKTMGFFSSGHIKMEAIVDRRAYAPGETMAIVVKINNSSSSEMTPKFALVREVVFRAGGSTKCLSSNVHKLVDKSIHPHTEKTVHCGLKIPHDQTQTIQNCEIISVEYYLKVYLDISFSFDPTVKFPVVILPPDLAPGSLYGASGGPSNSDLMPPVTSMRSCPPSPYSGRYRYPAAHRNSLPGLLYPGYPSTYSAPTDVYRGEPAVMSGGYNNPVPQHASPYGTPFSSSSSTPVVHPPPSAPTLHSPPFAPEIHPAPSAPTFDISPTGPRYSPNPLPSAPMMNTDFLSQMDEPPPAYSILFPSSAPDNSNANQ